MALMAAGMATFLGRRSWRYDAYDATCQHFEDHIEWRLGKDGALPEVWSRWRYADHPTPQQQAEFEFLKPRQYGPPERAPMVHWQVRCGSLGCSPAAGLPAPVAFACDAACLPLFAWSSHVTLVPCPRRMRARGRARPT